MSNKFGRSSEDRAPGRGPGDTGSSPVGQPKLSFWEKLRDGEWCLYRRWVEWGINVNEGGYWVSGCLIMHKWVIYFYFLRVGNWKCVGGKGVRNAS